MLYVVWAIASAAVLGYASYYKKHEWLAAPAVVSIICALLGWLAALPV